MSRPRRKPRTAARPVIALTMGDPAGIGPELCLAMLKDPEVLAVCTPVVFGEALLLRRVARATGQPVPGPVVPFKDWTSRNNDSCRIVDLGCPGGKHVEPGRISADTGSAAHRCVVAAVREAMASRVAAVVTAPLSKEALHLAGVPHPGHTELLAELTGAPSCCMMLASERIITSLVTTHVALGRVAGQISEARILEVIRLTAATAETLRRRKPRLTVCGLNPHGGENGLLGTEDRDIIAPAVHRARAEGFDVEGPLPPDTAFLPGLIARTEAYICMYHDQGLIPFKMLAFETGVNITLGLPIIRTSPDHGTAFDLAWTGRANPSSMRCAILYAARLSAV